MHVKVLDGASMEMRSVLHVTRRRYCPCIKPRAGEKEYCVLSRDRAGDFKQQTEVATKTMGTRANDVYKDHPLPALALNRATAAPALTSLPLVLFALTWITTTLVALRVPVGISRGSIVRIHETRHTRGYSRLSRRRRASVTLPAYEGRR